MVKKLQDFSQHPGHAAADCTVVCILSHGEEGYIFGADGRKFELDAIFKLFDNTCCPDLRGKPKSFIIQACRGGRHQNQFILSLAFICNCKDNLSACYFSLFLAH